MSIGYVCDNFIGDITYCIRFCHAVSSFAVIIISDDRDSTHRVNTVHPLPGRGRSHINKKQTKTEYGPGQLQSWNCISISVLSAALDVLIKNLSYLTENQGHCKSIVKRKKT